MTKPFDLLEEHLEAYKRKTYDEISALPDSVELHDPRLPENSKAIRLTVTRHAEGRLTITLKWTSWITKEEHEEFERDFAQQLENVVRQDADVDESDIEELLAAINDPQMTAVAHPENENLVS
jgi:hypothetical protein